MYTTNPPVSTTATNAAAATAHLTVLGFGSGPFAFRETARAGTAPALAVAAVSTVRVSPHRSDPPESRAYPRGRILKAAPPAAPSTECRVLDPRWPCRWIH